MNPSRIFIMRPVATTLLMAAILLAGAAAYKQLPVSALPQVDYPTIQVLTFFPGASPDVMASSVTAPLERQFGQMPGLAQMWSSSSGGASVITLRFDLKLHADFDRMHRLRLPIEHLVPPGASDRMPDIPAIPALGFRSREEFLLLLGL